MKKAAGCPGCKEDAGTRAANRYFPFCSERCRMADLGQWFAGRYAIPEDPVSAAEPANDPAGPSQPPHQ